MFKNPRTASALSAYVPADRLQALRSGRSLPDRTAGAALFADISGFTPLAEALVGRLGSRRGAEELTRQVNQVYDALTAAVARSGGSVIGFSGDAITCWFDQEPGALTLYDCASRAAACAFAMQQVMQAFAAVPLPSGDAASLAMKIAVATGPARRFVVGDRRIQWIDILAGETLQRMAQAEHVAQRGEVVVDAATSQALGSQAQVQEWRQDEQGRSFAILNGLAPLLLLPISPAASAGLPADLDPHLLEPWLLSAVFERMAEGLGEFLTELRPAVAMFIRFEGIDYDGDDAAGDKLNAYICFVQGVLDRYGGHLSNLTIGDKGSYLFAAFGAPAAHEDDARRAVSAAWELRHPPTELDFISQPQIGLNQGASRTGAYGGAVRRTYGILGDSVNLAARLMQCAAPGETLATLPVREAAGADFSWDLLPPVPIKGKREPVPVARLVGPGGLPLSQGGSRAGQQTYRSAFVGRELELERLTGWLSPLFAAPETPRLAGVISIFGEAGIGKSRLVYETQQRARSQALQAGLALRWFDCPAEQILRQSLNPFKHFLREYFAQDPSASEALNKQRFDSIFTVLENALVERSSLGRASEAVRELERTRSFLGALVDLDWPGSLYDQLRYEPKLRFENTLAAFKALVLAEASLQPVLIHIEDAHWLDPDSLALLQFLAHNLPAETSLGILLTARYLDDGSRLALSYDQAMPQHVLDLQELSSESVGLLAGDLLHGPAGESLNELLASKTNGNPFFVEQLLLDLRERGLLQRHPGAAGADVADPGPWEVAAESWQELPVTITAVLISRLDRLVARVRVVVQTAAVLGSEFEVMVLSRMLHEHPNLLNEIHQAETEMVWSALSELRYLFRHNMMRDAAYEMQVQERLCELHAVAGEVIEQIFAADLAPHAADLAYHFGRAASAPQHPGRPERLQKAFSFARQAGQRAAARFANHEARKHLLEALQFGNQLEASWFQAGLPIHPVAQERQAIQAELGQLLAHTGQYEPAVNHLQQALALAIDLDQPEQQAQACRWLARVYELRGEYPQALEWIERGLAALGQAETPEAAQLRLIAGLVYSRQGEQERAWQAGEIALRIARQVGDTRALARAYNLLGHLHRLLGQTARGVEQFQRAYELYQAAGDVNGEATTLNLLAYASLYNGQLKEGEAYGRKARQVFDRIGDRYNRSFADNNLGEILLKRGKLAEAAECYAAALQTMEQIGGSAYVLGALHNNLSTVFLRRAQPEAARRHLQQSQAFFEKAQARDFLPEMRRHLAEAALLAGDLPEAEEQAQQALILARQQGLRGDEGSSLRVLGEIAAARGELVQAVALLRQGVAIMQETGDEFEGAFAHLALARLCLQQGDAPAARASLDVCTPFFERQENALDLAEARRLASQAQELQ